MKSENNLGAILSEGVNKIGLDIGIISNIVGDTQGSTPELFTQRELILLRQAVGNIEHRVGILDSLLPCVQSLKLETHSHPAPISISIPIPISIPISIPIPTCITISVVPPQSADTRLSSARPEPGRG